tara:strand:- start:1295 stop:1681 length:387 start_codon:yes stop_codon:yes gene_type:complete
MSNLYNKNLWFLALQELNINIKGIKRGESIYDNILWIDEENKPDKSVILSKIEEINNLQPLKILREERNLLLDKTDKYVVIDYPHPSEEVKQAWLTYRQELRDLPATATPQLDENENLTNVTWPTPPS